MNDLLLHCSFCGKSQREVWRLFAGPDAMICNECVRLLGSILDETPEPPPPAPPPEPPPVLQGPWKPIPHKLGKGRR